MKEERAQVFVLLHARERERELEILGKLVTFVWCTLPLLKSDLLKRSGRVQCEPGQRSKIIVRVYVCESKLYI